MNWKTLAAWGSFRERPEEATPACRRQLSRLALLAALVSVLASGIWALGGLRAQGDPGAANPQQLSQLVWSFKSECPALSGMSSPNLSAGTVYFTGGDQRLYAVDAGTGALRWTRRTAMTFASPVAVGNLVYYGDQKGFFWAVDGKTGTEK